MWSFWYILLQVPIDAVSGAARGPGHLGHTLAFRQPHRHLTLPRRQAQGRSYLGGGDPKGAPRLDQQDQRGHGPCAVARVRNPPRV